MSDQPVADTKTKIVWILSDGRPGHFNQAKGVVKALSLIQPIETVWLDTRLRVGFFRIVQRELLKHTRTAMPQALLRLFYDCTIPEQAPDMIVSAGGRTSFANAWLARFYSVPNIFIGSLRGLPAELFSAVLTLEPIPDVNNNIVLRFPVSEITPDYLEAIEIPENLATKTCWALLAGGDGAGYHYMSEDWLRLGALLNKLAEQYAIQWLVCSAQRSGKAAQILLQDSIDKQYLADVSWFSAQAGNQMPLYLAVADKVFVTEDSMTMLGEAMASGKPVFSLRPEVARPNQRYRNALQGYVTGGLLSQHSISGLLLEPAQIDATSFEKMTASPLQALSRQLQQKLPGRLKYHS